MNPFIAFITGLTAGGLSCLAAQAGLLASSIGDHTKYNIEDELRDQRQSMCPVLLFLLARLASYTLLGFMLGWLGTALQLSPHTRAILLILIGIFMLGTALRMLNIHPIFRYFVIEPPKSLTRYIRRKAKNDHNQALTPIILGTLTVLIPCGITQVMMAAAIASGNPLTGALILFAFILGTSPILFLLAYLATKLGGKLQANFAKVIGAVIFIVALVTMNSGLNLGGSPISINNIKKGLQANAKPAAAAVIAGDTIRLEASASSYSPGTIRAKANQAYKLEITSKNNAGCGRAFTIPSLDRQEILPANGTITMEIPPQQAGKMQLTCAMGMYNATIEFI